MLEVHQQQTVHLQACLVLRQAGEAGEEEFPQVFQVLPEAVVQEVI
jgi:hypothetical protein